MFNRLAVEDTAAGQVVVMDDNRVVVPEQMRRELLEMLHQYHQSSEQMLALATKRWYLPELKAQVKDLWFQCEICQTHRPGKTREHPMTDLILVNLAPMEILNMDFCQFGGKYYLVAADRATGFHLLDRLRTNPLTKLLNS